MSPSSSATTTKPIILALHGRGTNKLIFTFQSRRLVNLLSPLFRFVFVDAPFESDAGDGVLPVFEGCGPYWGWRMRRWREIDGVKEGDGVEREREEIWRGLDLVVGREARGGWGDVVGVMGFSEGAQLGMGLVIGQLLGERVEGKGDGDDNMVGGLRCAELRLKFAVLIGCPMGAIFVNDQAGRNGGQPELEVLKGFPTVFAWGREDPWKKEWPSMNELQKCNFWSVMEFEGEHHLPLTNEEAARLCELVKLAWEVDRAEPAGIEQIPGGKRCHV